MFRHLLFTVSFFISIPYPHNPHNGEQVLDKLIILNYPLLCIFSFWVLNKENNGQEIIKTF